MSSLHAGHQATVPEAQHWARCYDCAYVNRTLLMFRGGASEEGTLGGNGGGGNGGKGGCGNGGCENGAFPP